jgi:hypothetical protein
LSVYDDIKANNAAGTLARLIADRAGDHRSDEEAKEFRAALVELHNAGAIDALEAARAVATGSIPQHEVFLLLSAYAAIIPDLADSVPAMLAAVRALVARAGSEGPSGMPLAAFRRWAVTGARARETIALINVSDSNDATYLYLALSALAQTELENAFELAISLLNGESVPARSAAAKTISSLPFVSDEMRERALQALDEARSNRADDNLLGEIIAAATSIARGAPSQHTAAIALVDAIACDGVGDATVHSATITLMMHADDLSPAIVQSLTTVAHKVRIQNGGALGLLDSAASALLYRGRVDEALALVVPLLSTHHELSTLDQLDGFAHGLLALDRQRLFQIVVRWLLSPDRSLGEATASLVGEHHRGPLLLEFDAAVLALSDAETILLAHRTIGFLFIHPITAASVIVSLMRTSSPGAREAISEILFDPLLINFSGELADWLKTKAIEGSNPIASTIEGLLARLEAYLEGLRRVPRIKELRPSERERLIETHRQHEAMLRAHKAAQKKSVLMSIVSRSVLLYGNRSISYFEGREGSKQRNEMKLHSFSHSVEAPRLDVLEPFELDYTLRVFRAMRLVQ